MDLQMSIIFKLICVCGHFALSKFICELSSTFVVLGLKINHATLFP